MSHLISIIGFLVTNSYYLYFHTIYKFRNFYLNKDTYLPFLYDSTKTTVTISSIARLEVMEKVLYCIIVKKLQGETLNFQG